MDKSKEIKELEELCKPVVDYLKRNYDPYCSIIISDNQVKLTREELGIPVSMKENKKETAQEIPVQEQNSTVNLKIDISELAKVVSSKINELQRKNSFNLII